MSVGYAIAVTIPINTVGNAITVPLAIVSIWVSVVMALATLPSTTI